MKEAKFSESQIVSILKQADAGLPVKDRCRQAGISTATYYQWKSTYGGMEASDLKRVRKFPGLFSHCRNRNKNDPNFANEFRGLFS